MPSREDLKVPSSTEDLKNIYDFIYASGKPVHPKRGELHLYGSHTNRDSVFVNYLREMMPKGSVLDASCGRGHLARNLKAHGYEVFTTEISSWLVENELKDLGTMCLSYDGLPRLSRLKFDAVISNDVLEHLVDEAMVDRALKNLHALASKFILISIGAGPSPKYAEALRLPIMDLHLIHQPIRWWKDKIEKYMRLISMPNTKQTWYFLGRAKR